MTTKDTPTNSLLADALAGFSGQLPSLPLETGVSQNVTIASEPYQVDEREMDNPGETTGNKVLVVDVICNADGNTYTVYLQSGMLIALARANRLAGLPLDSLPLHSTYNITKVGVGKARPGRSAPNQYVWEHVTS